MQAKTNDTTTTRGREAEALAARHLEGCGQRVVERNFRIRGGEIDLICRDGKTLVFVEVRQRSRGDFGGAAASITAAKRRRLVRTALWYAQREGLSEGAIRFDVVAIERLADGSARLRHEPGAFDADGR